MTVNGTLAPDARPVALAASVYPTPFRLIERSSNVATPATAVRVSVPLSVPPPGLVPMATVTAPVKDVTVLPAESVAVTVMDGTITPPASTEDGTDPTTRRAALPAVMLKAEVVAD